MYDDLDASSDTFWPRFVERSWAKEPIVLRGAAAPLIDADALLEGVKLAVFAGASGRDGDTIRCFAGGRMLTGGPELTAFLPDTDSMTAYAEKVGAALGGQQFGVVVKDIADFCPGLQQRIRSFAHGLVASAGIPSQGISIGTFFGTYPETPYGIHFDDASVFAFPVVGRKKVLVWSPDYFQKRGIPTFGQSLFAGPEAFARDAVVLEGGPGDVLFWPAGFWHVAVAGGAELHATVNMTCWFERPLSQWIASKVASILAEVGADSMQRSCRPFDPRLPADVGEALGTVQRAVASGALRRALEHEWLRRISAGGIDARAYPVAVKLTHESAVRGDARWPILLRPGDGAVEVFGNGQVSTTRSGVIEPLARRLNAGEWVRCGAMYDELTAPLAAEARGAELAELERVVSWLARVGALEHREPR